VGTPWLRMVCRLISKRFQVGILDRPSTRYRASAPDDAKESEISADDSKGRSSPPALTAGRRLVALAVSEPFAIVKVGTVKVAKNGSVSARGVKFTYAPDKTTTVVSTDCAAPAQISPPRPR